MFSEIQSSGNHDYAPTHEAIRSCLNAYTHSHVLMLPSKKNNICDCDCSCGEALFMATLGAGTTYII